MQIHIETGDKHTDALVRAALPLWETRLTMLSQDGTLLVCDEGHWLTADMEHKDASMVILLYRDKSWLDLPEHRKLRSMEISYIPLPYPVSLPQLAEAIARMDVTAQRQQLPLRLIPEGRKVRYGNQEVHLTEKEYQLLTLLYENEGQPVSKMVMQQTVWPEGVGGNVCEVNMTHLRQKLTPLLGEGAIGSIRGKGYFLRLG